MKLTGATGGVPHSPRAEDHASKNRLSDNSCFRSDVGERLALGAANPTQAQTIVHVRTADLRPSDTANVKIQPAAWHGYYHSYYRAPYGAYYRPYRAYYRPYYRPYYGAYRAWYGNPYYFYPQVYGSYYYPSYGYPYPYSTYYSGYPYPYASGAVVTPFGGVYW